MSNEEKFPYVDILINELEKSKVKNKFIAKALLYVSLFCVVAGTLMLFVNANVAPALSALSAFFLVLHWKYWFTYEDSVKDLDLLRDYKLTHLQIFLETTELK